jgi:hypothetical protein
MGNHMFMSIYPSSKFTKLRVGGRRFNTRKIVLLVGFRDPPMIKSVTFNKGLQ